MSEVIPFGKYKGQDIEQVRMRDPQYLQWLTQQAWFVEKFAPLHQTVINVFAPPSEDTPAHNALQVRFLEDKFREAFWNVLNLYVGWADLERDWKRRSSLLRKAPAPHLYRQRTGVFYGERWKEHRERVREHWKTWRRAKEAPDEWCSIGDPQFETACDVEFRVVAQVGHRHADFRDYNARTHYRLAIEIKPSMGDDYPAVLRQIKRQQAGDRVTVGADVTQWALLLDEFGSSSVTLDQVRRMFSREDIEVVLVSEVREQLILNEHLIRLGA